MRISGAKTYRRGAPGWAQPSRARPPLLACPGGLYPPGGPTDLNPDTINSYFRRKNQGERIIAIHEKEPPPSPVLPQEGRSGLAQTLIKNKTTSNQSLDELFITKQEQRTKNKNKIGLSPNKRYHLTPLARH